MQKEQTQSTRVSAPDAATDALGAGDAGVQQLKSYATMIVPMLVWFYIIPALTGMLFETEYEWIEKPGSRPPPPIIDENAVTFDPLADEGATDPAMVEEYEPEMMEVELPITWTEYFLKSGLMIVFMFFGMLMQIWVGQEGMLYVTAQPFQYIEQNPVRYQAPTQRDMSYEEIWLEAKDGIKLEGWFLYQKVEPEKKNTIIFFHENAGNIGLRMDWFEIIYKSLNCNIVGVSYRGFGRSQGKPHQDGIMLDAAAMLDFAKSEPKINNERVFIAGRSLGGATAIHTAARLAEEKDEWVKGVIIENTFTSVSKIADNLFGFLKAIPNLKRKMLRLDWNSEVQIAKVKLPMLFVAGQRDQLCPMSMTMDLYSAATSTIKKDILAVPNADHNNTFMLAGQDYVDKLRTFMCECLGEEPPRLEAETVVNASDTEGPEAQLPSLPEEEAEEEVKAQSQVAAESDGETEPKDVAEKKND